MSVALQIWLSVLRIERKLEIILENHFMGLAMCGRISKGMYFTCKIKALKDY
jgi:hypothetical protein